MIEDILKRIALNTEKRVAEYKEKVPLEEMKAKALALPAETGFPFKYALRTESMSFICEVKKASPSRGVIAEDFPYLEIAKDYERAGASAISVLTEPKWFLGNDSYLSEIAAAVSIPCLRKDFIIDEYMIYQSKVLGASAILLICSLLDEETREKYIALSESLGMAPLVEAHSVSEITMAVRAGARIIGVNNRNLRNFEVDMSNSSELSKVIPDNVVFVAESGIEDASDVEMMREAGADAVLVGETLMRASDRKAKLAELRGPE